MNCKTHRVPFPSNEPARCCDSGSPEREALTAELERQIQADVTIPLIIGGREIASGDLEAIRCPHDHTLQLGQYHQASAEHVKLAIRAAGEVARDWARVPWQDRAAVFLKAAELLTTTYRSAIVAATMLSQSKTAEQAELDAACELADFWRFNPYFMEQILCEQPLRHAPGSWNRALYRALEGFVFAVTPFNFTAIGGNLPTAPAMMGNVVLWKPASTAVLSSYLIMRILRKAGLPDGVINFVPGPGSSVGDPALDSRELAGLHFTGSTTTFNRMWSRIGDNVAKGAYRTYPRIVGETGGKGFVIAAPEADVDALAVALFRGAFEYQGQKCSAASRAYVPRSLWPDVRLRIAAMAQQAPMGDVADPRTFLGAVIDRAAFNNIREYIEHAKHASDATIVMGGDYDDKRGYFIEPTVIETIDAKYRTMQEEIFGPVLTVYPFDDDRLTETLMLVDETSPYALTGAIFAHDQLLIRAMIDVLEQAAGNLYVNDKPTGAVVGQQPFGGARLSGTNDKAGSPQNLLRWSSACVIKENFSPPKDFCQ